MDRLILKLKNFFVSKSTCIGFFAATGIVWASDLFLELFGLSLLENSYKLIIFIFMFVISKVVSKRSDTDGPLDNWDFWQKVLTSTPILMLVLLSSAVSMSYAVIPSEYKASGFPLTFHLYWVSGFSIFLSSIFFQLFAPRIFKYKNFGAFKSEIGSFFDIWENIEDAKTVLGDQLKNGRCKYGNVKEYGILVRANKKNICPHVFLLAKKHLRYEYPWLRGVVGILLIPSAYIIPGILAWNSTGIFIASIKEIKNYIVL
jgi:hypothetical protein